MSGYNSVNKRSGTDVLARSPSDCHEAARLSLLHDFAHHVAELVALKNGVPQRRVKVDGVVVATSFVPHQEHALLPKGTDDAPDCPGREGHRLRYVLDGAVGTDGDVEEDGSVARNKIPIVAVCHVESPRNKTPVSPEALQ